MKQKQLIGVVLAVGPGKKDEKPQVKAGDHVYFGKYSGTEVMAPDHLVISESEILGIVER